MGLGCGHPPPAKQSRSKQADTHIKEIKIQVQTCFEDMDAASERAPLMDSVVLVRWAGVQGDCLPAVHGAVRPDVPMNETWNWLAIVHGPSALLS